MISLFSTGGETILSSTSVVVNAAVYCSRIYQARLTSAWLILLTYTKTSIVYMLLNQTTGAFAVSRKCTWCWFPNTLWMCTVLMCRKTYHWSGISLYRSVIICVVCFLFPVTCTHTRMLLKCCYGNFPLWQLASLAGRLSVSVACRSAK